MRALLLGPSAAPEAARVSTRGRRPLLAAVLLLPALTLAAGTPLNPELNYERCIQKKRPADTCQRNLEADRNLVESSRRFKEQLQRDVEANQKALERTTPKKR